MRSHLLFSNNQLLKNYIQLIRLVILNKDPAISATKTTIRLRLVSKKLLRKLYKRILKINVLSNFINSNIFITYSLLKRYLFAIFPWAICNYLNIKNLIFFTYHFLIFYRVVFVMKMVLDWFPIKNWDRASPLKRFLRRVTISWTKKFEKYLPSIVAWLIVINIVPMLLSLIETFYLTNDFQSFPISYKFDEIVEFILESNLQTNKQKLI